MADSLLSVGVDVGTTTTQLIVSRLVAENRAGAFAVPKMEITERNVIYESDIHFTPLISSELVDGEQIRSIVTAEYEKAGIRRQDVDTGAIIITGETSRKENAAAVLAALSDMAGEFVVATAGPDLESVLAAKGAGAVEYSYQTGKRVLHMDIGGGTSNLCLAEDGNILFTACLNVGGRLMKFTPQGRITYISPVLRRLIPYREGQVLEQAQAMEVARLLAQALEAAAGLRQPFDAYDALITQGTVPPENVGACVISFSGGVADCIAQPLPWLQFGDLGPLLGIAIRESLLCQGAYRMGSQTIRATVIGAGCHSTQLSGSTVFLQNVKLPLKNLPVAAFTPQEQESEEFSRLLAQRLREKDGEIVVLALPGYDAPGYAEVIKLAERIAKAANGKGVYVCMEWDMAKALGHALALRLPADTPILCLDRVQLTGESFLDVGTPVGPCLPVVIKTLVFSAQQ